MPASPARKAAFDVLSQVETGRAFAVDLLQGTEFSKLSDLDRSLATEIVMGVLRWRGELDFQLVQLSGKPLKYFDPAILTALRMGIYQIRFLERIPKGAAVNEAVELAKQARKHSAAALVNAVLRKCQPAARRPRAAGKNEVDTERLVAARRCFPDWLLRRWKTDFGAAAADTLILACNAVPRTTLCVPPEQRETIRQELEVQGIRTELSDYANSAILVRSGRVQRALDRLKGRGVIQDEASQLVAALLAPRPGERVIDLCAAPGMKAGQLAAMLRSGTLVACDRSAGRLRTMARLLRARIPSGVRVFMLQVDAAAEPPFGLLFDRVLVDAPCSGTGTLARNPEIKWRLQETDVTRMAELQAKILRNALPILAPGGRLVYATCSLEPEENELVVESALDEAKDFHLLGGDKLENEFPKLAAFFDPRGYFRTRPDLHGMDGFCAAVITRAPQPHLHALP